MPSSVNVPKDDQSPPPSPPPAPSPSPPPAPALAPQQPQYQMSGAQRDRQLFLGVLGPMRGTVLLEQLKEFLIVLLHSQTCLFAESRGTNPCNLEFCKILKPVIAHLPNCQTDITEICSVHLCCAARVLLGHWNACKIAKCFICSPVKWAFWNRKPLAAMTSLNSGQPDLEPRPTVDPDGNEVPEKFLDDLEEYLVPPRLYEINSEAPSEHTNADAAGAMAIDPTAQFEDDAPNASIPHVADQPQDSEVAIQMHVLPCAEYLTESAIKSLNSGPPDPLQSSTVDWDEEEVLENFLEDLQQYLALYLYEMKGEAPSEHTEAEAAGAMAIDPTAQLEDDAPNAIMPHVADQPQDSEATVPMTISQCAENLIESAVHAQLTHAAAVEAVASTSQFQDAAQNVSLLLVGDQSEPSAAETGKSIDSAQQSVISLNSCQPDPVDLDWEEVSEKILDDLEEYQALWFLEIYSEAPNEHSEAGAAGAGAVDPTAQLHMPRVADQPQDSEVAIQTPILQCAENLTESGGYSWEEACEKLLDDLEQFLALWTNVLHSEAPNEHTEANAAGAMDVDPTAQLEDDAPNASMLHVADQPQDSKATVQMTVLKCAENFTESAVHVQLTHAAAAMEAVASTSQFQNAAQNVSLLLVGDQSEPSAAETGKAIDSAQQSMECDNEAHAENEDPVNLHLPVYEQATVTSVQENKDLQPDDNGSQKSSSS